MTEFANCSYKRCIRFFESFAFRASLGSMQDTERLRAAGLRVTSARLAILDAVRSGTHPGAGEVAPAGCERLGHAAPPAGSYGPAALPGPRPGPPGPPSRQ